MYLVTEFFSIAITHLWWQRQPWQQQPNPFPRHPRRPSPPRAPPPSSRRPRQPHTPTNRPSSTPATSTTSAAPAARTSAAAATAASPSPSSRSTRTTSPTCSTSTTCTTPPLARASDSPAGTGLGNQLLIRLILIGNRWQSIIIHFLFLFNHIHINNLACFLNCQFKVFQKRKK